MNHFYKFFRRLEGSRAYVIKIDLRTAKDKQINFGFKESLKIHYSGRESWLIIGL